MKSNWTRLEITRFSSCSQWFEMTWEWTLSQTTICNIWDSILKEKFALHLTGKNILKLKKFNHTNQNSFRPNAAKAFIQLLNQPPLILKDCIRLMSQELQPSVELPRRWSFNLCLTVPPNYVNIVPVGHQAGKFLRYQIIPKFSLFLLSHDPESESCSFYRLFHSIYFDEW